jgi:hypothetical protein
VKVLGAVRAFSVGPSVPKGTPSSDDVCVAAARTIADHREALGKLVGKLEAGLEADAAAALEATYRKSIDANLSLFVAKAEQSGTIGCAVRPPTAQQQPTQQRYELLKTAKSVGFESGSGSSCVIPAAFGPASIVGSASTFWLDVLPSTVDLGTNLRQAGVDKAHDRTSANGFFYRVPALARVTVEERTPAATPPGGTTTIPRSQSDHLVAQLGIVAALPAQRTYQTKYTVTLDPLTGALRKLSADNDAPDPALLTGTGGAIAGALDAEAARDAEEAKAKDELAVLERERKILEEKKKIRELKEAEGDGN